MMATYPKVRLGSFLKHRKEFFTLDGTAQYKRVRIQLHNKGIVLRDIVEGSELRTKKQQAVKAGDLLVAEIDAKVGGFGISPPELDGAIVSSHYFLYEIDKRKCLPGWLDAFIRVGRMEEQVKARGSTNYAAIRPEHTLDFEIPLPPLPEQRRIVARIDELAANIEEARALRQQTAEEVEALTFGRAGQVFLELGERFARREFGSFSPHVTSGPRNWATHYEKSGYRFYRAQDIGPEGQVLEGAKVFITPPPGEQGRSAMLQSGDLMLVITGATVGRCAVFREGLEPGFVNQHVAICRLPTNEADPEFVLWGLRSPDGKSQLLAQRYGQGKPGLNLSNIRALSLPFPPISEQRRIVAELDAFQVEVDALRRLQAETAAELDALLPSILDKAFKGEL